MERTIEREHGGVKTVSQIKTLEPIAFAFAAALIASVIMLLIGAFGAIGIHQGGVEMMMQWHLFFEPTVLGTLAGMIEAAIITFIVVYGFAWLYNSFSS